MGTHDYTSLFHGFRSREISDSVLLEKLVVAQIVKTLPPYKTEGSLRFVLHEAEYWPLSWAV
jgi:hypothetical protein